ncbi:hypothetical protein F0170_20415 [Pseudomonas sp. MAFF 730085]|uniref:Uncharacterized protein n=1 Tax=Pseudomonas kitaguniensis TaxID=2607908 RepID=A0A5N7JXM2_9PSED|nr:hypothetical protein [Pseudomonas kitaguniensis]MPQ86145.1 hypothetical protein [Pseudomonas kitaguniensis]
MNVPALGFTLQDSALPIPNLNTSLLTGNSAEVMCSFPLLPMDFVNINMISNVLGGDHNQSFSIAQGVPSLIAQIPRERVEANEGNSVRLRVSIRRSGVSLSAPDATVTINRRPIVIPPTPDVVWDFKDGTFQGWVAQGSYTGGVLRIVGGRVVADVPDSQLAKSHIITRTILVTAGRTYDFAFDASAGDPADGSMVFLTINGSRIGATVQNINLTQQSGSGSFVATMTGNVTLGLFNDAVPLGRHRLSLGNISMTQRP